MDVSLVGTALTVLGIVVGGVCVLLLVSTKTLRDSRDDQEKRITFLERKSARDENTIREQAHELGVLKKLVTGEVQLAALLDLLDHHHTQAVSAWEEVQTTLTHIDHTLETTADALRELL